MSDFANVLEHAALVLGSATPNVSVFQAALRVCQEALQKAQSEVRQLRIENETLKAAASGPSSSSLRRDVVPWLKSDILVPHHKLIISFAKKFVVMCELWPDEAAFLKPCPAGMPSVQERYASPEAYIIYTTFQLYANAPTNFHGYIHSLPAFKSAALYQNIEMRSSIASANRKSASGIFKGFNLSNTCWEDPANRLVDIECLSLISRNPTDKPITYDLYPPILYGNVRNRTDIYMQMALMQIARLILFGPGSIKGQGKVCQSTSAQKWGPIQTTPSLVALTSAVAVYLLSGDKAFEATGRVTGIPYRLHYQKRKRLLEETEHSDNIQKLFEQWDNHVFMGVSETVRKRRPQSGNSKAPLADEQEEARQALLDGPSNNDLGTNNFDEDFDFDEVDGSDELDEPDMPMQITNLSSASSHVPVAAAPIPPPVVHAPTAIPDVPTTISAQSMTRRSRIPSGMSILVAPAPQISVSQPEIVETPVRSKSPEIPQDLTAMTIGGDVNLPTEASSTSRRGRGNARRGRGAARGKAAVPLGERAMTRSQT